MGYLGTKPANSPLTSELIPDGLINTSDLADSSVTAAKILNANVTPAKLSQPLTLGTSVASTSGTSINFTGIPSWVKRVTLIFENVSTSGSGNVRFRLGTSSGIKTSGYGSTGTYTGSESGGAVSSAGFDFFGDASAGSYRTGTATFVLVGSNTWAMFCSAYSGNTYLYFIAGGVTLDGALTTAQLTTSNGTDTFDLGSINILYE